MAGNAGRRGRTGPEKTGLGDVGAIELSEGRATAGNKGGGGSLSAVRTRLSLFEGNKYLLRR